MMGAQRNFAADTEFVSIAVAEQEAAALQTADKLDFVDYTGCLEELHLFEQLGNLDVTEDDVDNSLLDFCAESTKDYDLVELVNEALADNLEIPTPIVTNAHTSSKDRRSEKLDRHTCEVCQRYFRESYNLRIHKMTHTDEKPYVCDNCGKGFRQLNKLRIHYVTHTNAKPYECDICGKGFRYANYLSVHRRLHTGEKPYACTECGSNFHSIHARRVHIKKRHATEVDKAVANVFNSAQAGLSNATSTLSYTCPICSRILTDQCYLNTHLKRHYNQRDFACSLCEKRFFSSSELKHHQIAHSLLRPFKCGICGLSFLRKSNYKQHLKIHAR